MKNLIMCVLMVVTFAISLADAQGFQPEPGLQASFMVPFVEVSADSGDVAIIDDVSAFYGGACYIWSTNPFFNGAGVYVRPGIEIDGGIRIADADLSVAVLFLRNLQFGVTWKAYGPKLDGSGDSGFRGIEGQTVNFFISLEAWSVIGDLFD